MLVNGELIPLFNPRSGGQTQETRMQLYVATRGAKIDTDTDSLFVNDRWNLNQFFNFNLGARFEKTKSHATGGIIGIDTSNFVPRLGASYDPLGNGKYKVDVTYAQYVGRYNPGIINANTPVGAPSSVYGYYIGPKGEGRDFAPGFDPNNYKFYTASVPTANRIFAKDLHAPISTEWSVSGGTALPKSGWLKATFTNRRYSQFIDNFTTVDLGCTNISLRGVNVGCVDNVLYKNTNGPKRVYQAVELQSHYDLTRSWGVEGNWTHQLKNHGNYEGESGQSLPLSAFGDRPEMQSPRELPYGRLNQFEANRVRLWTTYTFNLGRFGNLSSGLLYRYDTGTTYSYSTSVTRSAESRALNPGYKSVGSSVTLFFGDRGIGTFPSSSLFDASLQYSIPVFRLTPWIKVDVRNLTNKDTQISYNTTIFADPNSPLDSLGYRTGFTKVSPTTGVQTFGRPTSTTSFVSPREVLVYAGIRF